MNRVNIIGLSLTMLVLVVQIFIPVFNFNNLDIVADILIIFLTYIGFYYGRFYAIILGFIFGVTQDLVTQIDLLGSMAFSKSAIGFGLGTLALFRNIWSPKYRMIFIFLMYFLHFLLFYFFKFNGVSISIMISAQIIVIHSLLSFIIFIVIDKSFFPNGVTSNNN
jgi:cell shape-determining protein MreD